MRILFTFVGGPGHFYPLVSIARASVAAGHTVAVAGSGRMQSTIEAEGFTAFATSTSPRETPKRKPLLRVDPEREDRDLRENFARRESQTQAAAVLNLAREWQPDVVVRDEVDFGTAVAAEKIATPCATVLVLAAGGFLRNEVVAEPLHKLRARYGLPPDPNLGMLDEHLVLAPFPPSFRDSDFPLPGTAFSFRPSAAITKTNGDRPQPPTVYFTLGTEFNTESGDLFSRVLAGLGELPADVVATVGKHVNPTEFGPQPDHIRIERFIPQAQLLPQADLVISHGGAGSVLGALAHGLPSVQLPMGADQPHNARRIKDLGIAMMLDPVTATPEDVRIATSTVLADQRYRHAAERMQAEINALPGPESVIDLLEQPR